jgi:hypothetical protein
MSSDLRPYYVLLVAFSAKRITSREFQTLFVALFKNDQTTRSHDVYTILNDVFLVAEAFEPVDAPGPYAVNEAQLDLVAEHGLRRLDEIID